jgi:hypothetical protein
VQQFDFMNAKVLGIVINCANEQAGKGYGYYGSYYKKNGRHYGRSYGYNTTSQKK